MPKNTVATGSGRGATVRLNDRPLADPRYTRGTRHAQEMARANLTRVLSEAIASPSRPSLSPDLPHQDLVDFAQAQWDRRHPAAVPAIPPPTPRRRGSRPRQPAVAPLRPISPPRPIRPGFIVRDALAQFGPMSIAELHRAYKELVKDHNQGRPKKHHPMSYTSFHRYVAQMRRGGLVVNVGEKPMENPPDPNPLINWGMSTFPRRGNNAIAREAVQVVVALTTEGRRRPEAFHNVFPPRLTTWRPPGASGSLP